MVHTMRSARPASGGGCASPRCRWGAGPRTQPASRRPARRTARRRHGTGTRAPRAGGQHREPGPGSRPGDPAAPAPAGARADACRRQSRRWRRAASAAGTRLNGRVRNAAQRPDSRGAAPAQSAGASVARRLAGGYVRRSPYGPSASLVRRRRSRSTRKTRAARRGAVRAHGDRRRARCSARRRCLRVLVERLAAADGVAGRDLQRRLQPVGVDAENGHVPDSRRRLDARRRLSGERKIEPFGALVKARWPSFLLSPYRVHSPGLCVPSTQYRTRCAQP